MRVSPSVAPNTDSNRSGVLKPSLNLSPVDLNRGPEKLARSVASGREDEASQAFETFFATMLVREMRRALPDGLFSGAGSDVFESWFDQHLGQTLVERDALGLAGLVKTGIARIQESEAGPDVDARLPEPAQLNPLDPGPPALNPLQQELVLDAREPLLPPDRATEANPGGSR